ncbi:unnamed protein product [Aphanomyces euteiches]|uniref:EXPERA domain-containing protein n=1 Tax=Aphanomyces euteiches TaxID=100861 RepID=A0A6G0X2P5_9STRA|nr:hypothetical protein Ae201684_009042 [Aphanomyces euteiches]KAH9073829.1 hypothetical protein Ae201684P_003331 [Aphanomyces euteiches]KAH9151040.1 hypothetical protein AeRB84_006247 [Aphanomyces euteiches]
MASTRIGSDWFFIGWSLLSIAIALVCDCEAVLHDPKTYGKVEPLVNWPPPVVVHALHQWGEQYDKLLQFRPLWFKVCLWMEIGFQVPYYLFAIYGFVNRREWLRVPTLIYAAQSITVMVIVLVEQFTGEFKTSEPAVILGAYLPFFIVPFFFLIRASGPTMFGTKQKTA